MQRNVKKHLETLFPGLATRYRSWRDMRMFMAQVMRPTALGFDFIGVPGMPESRTASGEVAMLRKLLQGKDLFVDIGANCGLYSLIAAKAGVPVLAVEPNRLNYLRLKQNIDHNGFANIQPHALALSDKPGRAALYGGGEGASLQRNWGGMTNTYAQEVEIDTLDNLLASQNGLGEILIKIDVEGHELAVLSGAHGLLMREKAPVWIMEHSFRENMEGRINPRFMELFELFWAAGYVCHTFDHGRRTVRRDDVERWLRTGVRDFGDVNYIFQKA